MDTLYITRLKRLEILAREEKLEKTQTALGQEQKITKILKADLDQVRKLRKQDKDKKEKAQRELRELIEKLRAIIPFS